MVISLRSAHFKRAAPKSVAFDAPLKMGYSVRIHHNHTVRAVYVKGRCPQVCRDLVFNALFSITGCAIQQSTLSP